MVLGVPFFSPSYTINRTPFFISASRFSIEVMNILPVRFALVVTIGMPSVRRVHETNDLEDEHQLYHYLSERFEQLVFFVLSVK